MSRIIVTRYDNGDDHIVVGWDHPCQGAYWQEFNREPDPDPKTGEVDWETPENQQWSEMKRYEGYMPGIPLDKFPASVPDDLAPLILTDEIAKLLYEHSEDPDSGRIIVDLSDQHERTTVNA